MRGSNPQAKAELLAIPFQLLGLSTTPPCTSGPPMSDLPPIESISMRQVFSGVKSFGVLTEV